MATNTDPRRTVRVIASHGNNNKEHETVNIVTSRSAADLHSIPEWKQQTSAPLTGHKTVIPAAASQKHLRTVFISGYTAPV